MSVDVGYCNTIILYWDVVEERFNNKKLKAKFTHCFFFFNGMIHFSLQFILEMILLWLLAHIQTKTYQKPCGLKFPSTVEHFSFSLQQNLFKKNLLNRV